MNVSSDIIFRDERMEKKKFLSIHIKGTIGNNYGEVISLVYFSE